MARPSQLKVFRMAVGFHDAYVAAPTQKAAIEAWGSDKGVFARGDAELVTDPALTAEPLASPGKIVKRLRGTAAEQIAALGPDEPGSAEGAEAEGESPPQPRRTRCGGGGPGKRRRAPCAPAGDACRQRGGTGARTPPARHRAPTGARPPLAGARQGRESVRESDARLIGTDLQPFRSNHAPRAAIGTPRPTPYLCGPAANEGEAEMRELRADEISEVSGGSSWCRPRHSKYHKVSKSSSSSSSTSNSTSTSSSSSSSNSSSNSFVYARATSSSFSSASSSSFSFSFARG